MRWCTAYSTALTLGLIPINAFLQGSRKVHSLTARSVGGLGWDNEDYLNALSNGPEAIKNANDSYRAKSRFVQSGPEEPETEEEKDEALPDPSVTGGTKGAQITEEMKEKMKASHNADEGASQGGSLFREMMARAQKGTPRPQTPPPQPSVPPTPTTMDPNNLSVEQQAQLFREMMMQRQQPPQTYNYPPPAPQTPIAPDGRKIGRNRDADSINNSADVYFAQLKLDSTLRNMAFHSGDYETANKVFNDPRINEIKAHVNPYLEEQRKKEQELLETAPDEMLEPILMQREESINLKNPAGPSYKEKLMQMKTKKKDNAGAAREPNERVESTSAPTAPQPVAPQVKAEAPKRPTALKLTEPKQAAPEATQPMPVHQSRTVDNSRMETWAEKLEIPTKKADEATNVVAPKSPEDFRKDIRTLMGLILKHRGGPGFGAGRLQGAEAQRLEDLANDISRALRQETARSPPKGEVSTAQLHETKPTEEKKQPAQTFTEAIAPTAPAYSTPPGHKINSMISCIEGAIQMYKNSPPELREGVLVTMRAALLSAVNTCNEIIANNEIKNFETYRTTVTDKRSPTESSGSYDNLAPASPSAAETVASAGSNKGTESNSQFLEEVYLRLQKAAGDGKMGLRGDLTPDEAAQLADDLAEVRLLLVDELENGLPERSEVPAQTQSSPVSKNGSVSMSSKYQEMLTKARTEKETKSN